MCSLMRNPSFPGSLSHKGQAWKRADFLNTLHFIFTVNCNKLTDEPLESHLMLACTQTNIDPYFVPNAEGRMCP